MRSARASSVGFGRMVSGRFFGQSRPCSFLPPALGDASSFHQLQAPRPIGLLNHQQFSRKQFTSIMTCFVQTARTSVCQLTGLQSWSMKEVPDSKAENLGALPGRHGTREHFNSVPALQPFETRRRHGSTVGPTPRLTSAPVPPTASVTSSCSVRDSDSLFGGDFPGSSMDGSGASHEQVGGSALDSVVKVFTVASSPNYWLPWQNKPQREMTGSGE